jgi:hypothetical protein
VARPHPYRSQTPARRCSARTRWDPRLRSRSREVEWGRSPRPPQESSAFDAGPSSPSPPRTVRYASSPNLREARGPTRPAQRSDAPDRSRADLRPLRARGLRGEHRRVRARGSLRSTCPSDRHAVQRAAAARVSRALLPRVLRLLDRGPDRSNSPAPRPARAGVPAVRPAPASSAPHRPSLSALARSVRVRDRGPGGDRARRSRGRGRAGRLGPRRSGRRISDAPSSELGPGWPSGQRRQTQDLLSQEFPGSNPGPGSHLRVSRDPAPDVSERARRSSRDLGAPGRPTRPVESPRFGVMYQSPPRPQQSLLLRPNSGKTCVCSI